MTYWPDHHAVPAPRSAHLLHVLGNVTGGGMERYVANLLHCLDPLEFRVSQLVPHESAFTAELRAAGHPVYVAGVHDDPPWRSIQAAVEIIRTFGVDLVHAHMPKAHALAGLAGALTGVPVVATIHGMNVTTHEYGIFRTTGSSLITVCQEAFTQALAMGVPLDRLALIPNGVDTEVFRPGSGSVFRAQLGVPEGVPLVGYVGRLSHEKGPDVFLQVAEAVCRRHPGAHGVLVGEGNMAGHLAETIERLRLAGRVHLAGPCEAMDVVYPALDLLTVTSRSEGMPLAVLEAMACGVPVVAFAVGGLPEVVEFGTTGLLKSPGDWGGLVDQIVDLLGQAERRAAFGRAARRRVEERFHLRTAARLTVERYRQLLPRRVEPELPALRARAAGGGA